MFQKAASDSAAFCRPFIFPVREGEREVKFPDGRCTHPFVNDAQRAIIYFLSFFLQLNFVTIKVMLGWIFFVGYESSGTNLGFTAKPDQ